MMKNLLTVYFEKFKCLLSLEMKKKENGLDDSICQLANDAVWAAGNTIMANDVLNWINDKMEELQSNGVSEVNLIQGEMLYDFILKNQAEGKYKEISSNYTDFLHNSVVIVAMDCNGEIARDQLIRSKGGPSDQLQEVFNEQPILKINLSEQ